MLAEGTHKAKAAAMQLTKSTQKGTPGLNVQFEVTTPTGVEKVYWTGWLTEKTKDRTYESMAICGLNPETNTFDGTEVEIVVEHEVYEKDGIPKKIAKVKWVNKVGGFGEAPTEEVKSAFKDIDLKKEIMIARQRLGIKAKDAKVIKNHAPVIDGDEPLPF